MNPGKRYGIFFFFLIMTGSGYSQQNKYWVTFANKAGTTFDPAGYFDSKVMEDRQSQGLTLTDSVDYPVSHYYVNTVTSLVDSVSYTSRWLNGMAVYASPVTIADVKKLSFVVSVEEMMRFSYMTSANEMTAENRLSSTELALMKFQTSRMGGDQFRTKHLDGSGIRIALFDAGFPGVDEHPAFKQIRDNNRIIATYDFVSKRELVFAHNSHGTMTLSCVAGMLDSINTGMATGAEFLLARTERAFLESFSEEENWLAAVEWAYRHGANIISSSLGYANKRYFNTEMNGSRSLVARAASIAASKGILVVNAAGNEGSDPWHFIVTPGDADSVLTVGGTDPATDMHIYFSSFGPTSDGRMKPNVTAPASVIAANSTGWSAVEGTSFATPLVAGFAACVWQAHRDWSNMKLFHEIEKSAHLYPFYDYAHGYGIPQAGYFTKEKNTVDPTFDFVIVNNDLKIILREKYSYVTTEESLGYAARRNLYYRIDDSTGVVRFYTVVLAEQKEAIHYLISQFQPGDKITVHFEGYTNAYTITGYENPVQEIK